MQSQGQQMLETAQTLILKTSKRLNVSDEVISKLLNPNHIHTVDIPVIMDDGRTEIFRGYRVQHNNVLGPYKGGIRFHPQVSQEEVQALATLMSIKTSVAGIPLGGGKGGVVVDPRKLSRLELEHLSRAYVDKLFMHIGEDTDIPAPDVNTTPEIMAWMTDEYVQHMKSETETPNPSHKQLSEWAAAFTGKPVHLGGSLGRTEATGRGGVIALVALLAKLGRSKESLTIAVQGFGNVGYYFSKLASEQGYKVVAVSDSKTGIMLKDQAELDVVATLQCKTEKGALGECFCESGACRIDGGKTLMNDELLTLPVDVLVPAALENVINIENMKDIRAKIIVEMANGPITEDAYEYLISQGVIIIPDVLANAGGVVVSYLEWLQGTKNERWSEQEVNDKLHEIMTAAFERIWNQSVKRNIPLKEAAFEVAIERIVNEMH
ncbi:Glu/Leu/Phe/Val dehydrogenase [Candidatus Microgenomates bacterium]|nr:Glu/Leu/Phe/Val dehydrogenase [Candidatus Microgenomates bacterium]